MDNFGERLAALRKERGMSQEELAEKLQLTRQTISKWETGASTPDLELLMRLAEVFGISMDCLLREEKPSIMKKISDPFVIFFYIFLTVTFALGVVVCMVSRLEGYYGGALIRTARMMIWAPLIIIAAIAVYKLIIWRKTKK